MRTGSRWVTVIVAVMALATASMPAQAVLPVIDGAAVKQLIAQVSFWRQQIAAMKTELGQLKQTYAALTGDRGMEALLPTSEAQRNYLPKDWAQMQGVLDGSSGTYGSLSSAVASSMQANQVLDAARLGRLGASAQSVILDARRSSAAAAVTAQRAYTNAGQRFAALQELVAAVGRAPDAKAIADLEARISAEEAMLGNEQAKLGTLYEAMQAEQWQNTARLREAAIAGHGEFATRFHPVLR